MHVGPYGTMATTHAAVVEWCAANGRELTGRSWEVYGDWTDDPGRLETEINYEVHDAPGHR